MINKELRLKKLTHDTSEKKAAWISANDVWSREKQQQKHILVVLSAHWEEKI